MKTMLTVLGDVAERGDIIPDTELEPGRWYTIGFSVFVTDDDVIYYDTLLRRRGDDTSSRRGSEENMSIGMRGEINPDDPEYQFEAKVFNAITQHPDIHFYFSMRQRLTKHLVDEFHKEVEALNAEVAERIRDHKGETE